MKVIAYVQGAGDDAGGKRPMQVGDVLVGQDGGQISLGHSPPVGGKLSWLSVAKATLGTAAKTSKLTDTTGVLAFTWVGLLTADLGVAGAGGLDTGAEAADTWYAVHAIADTTGVEAPDALLSLSATAPTLPGTHDVFKCMGWVRNNAAKDLLKFLEVWGGTTRRIVYDESAATMRALNNGSATDYTEVDLSAFVPSSALNVLLDRRFSTGAGGAAGDTLYLRPDGFGGGSLWQFSPGVLTTNKAKGFVEMPCPGQKVEYRGDQAANRTTISVAGYDHEL